MSGAIFASFLIWYVVFVFSTTAHEAAHALAAYLGGDRTAYEGGQVTLDPMPHIRRSPFGMVVIPIITFLMSAGGYMFGFASSPYDPFWAQRNPRKYAGMSLAGPIANFVLAGLAFAVMASLVHNGGLTLSSHFAFDSIVQAPSGAESGPRGALAMTLSVLFSLNVFLGLFNLLPIPPLDGAGVLEGAFPESVGTFFQKLRHNPMAGLIGMIIIFQFGGRLVAPMFEFVVFHALLFMVG
ncbi:MAG TPA: site-2 protease family protein [Polyangiaceae bacterium]|nr:site-2 protease family protein [Polyangiaceae bacterium]